MIRKWCSYEWEARGLKRPVKYNIQADRLWEIKASHLQKNLPDWNSIQPLLFWNGAALSLPPCPRRCSRSASEVQVRKIKPEMAGLEREKKRQGFGLQVDLFFFSQKKKKNSQALLHFQSFSILRLGFFPARSSACRVTLHMKADTEQYMRTQGLI